MVVSWWIVFCPVMINIAVLLLPLLIPQYHMEACLSSRTQVIDLTGTNEPSPNGCTRVYALDLLCVVVTAVKTMQSSSLSKIIGLRTCRGHIITQCLPFSCHCNNSQGFR